MPDTDKYGRAFRSEGSIDRHAAKHAIPGNMHDRVKRSGAKEPRQTLKEHRESGGALERAAAARRELFGRG